MRAKRLDRPFLVSIIVLAVGGFFIFNSASLGLLARSGAGFSSVAFSQTFYGLFLGTIALVVVSLIPYTWFRKYAVVFFALAILLTCLVFIPHVGFEHGGAKRWVHFSSFSFQPSEFLKIGYIIYLAAWISAVKGNIKTFKLGFLPFFLITAICGAILLMQPDTDTFLIMCIAGLSMFMIGGGQWKHVLLMILVGVLCFAAVAATRPYLVTRFTTFLNPSHDSLGAGYQIQQSLIAIGSGGITGRGFGQSLQKFNFLPEPISDSIFAVAAEEFGFIGALCIVGMFVFFAFRGLKIAKNAPDMFGGLMVSGIVILIVSQSFINIASMLGVFPLSGTPLLFLSHGGTALFAALAMVGIVLNISRFQKNERA